MAKLYGNNTQAAPEDGFDEQALSNGVVTTVYNVK